ncbi:hypothetical protein CCHR01_16232 [Colletotrichum chrysophilum]|uniref:Uncharacterized protein n=1 Tax=Colletotrichum chrysophilum TaxID=1836956 RepID=A0AAD9A672_9PEZI|nr:hypothetical protein CCHR01_16232 [Colletotrichum chrysophilum]
MSRREAQPPRTGDLQLRPLQFPLRPELPCCREQRKEGGLHPGTCLWTGSRQGPEPDPSGISRQLRSAETSRKLPAHNTNHPITQSCLLDLSRNISVGERSTPLSPSYINSSFRISRIVSLFRRHDSLTATPPALQISKP